MNEITDIRPDHIMLRNVFRQIQPNFLVATGPNNFLQELIGLLDLPESTDVKKYKICKGMTANANSSNISFYPFDRKGLQENYRKRIYELALPGITIDTSSSDRKIFVDSMFPMSQELVVIAIGNLLRYMYENNMKWRHAYLQVSQNPIITNFTVFSVEDTLLIDETTFNSLNIFSNIYHPSSFKTQIRRDGLSIFNMLNQCQSAVGVQELKYMLKQPIRDIKELKMRYTTIDWCLKVENYDFVLKIKDCLKNVLNINAVMGRIIVNHGKTNDWKSLKKTIFYSTYICEMCASLNVDNIRGTLLEEVASFGGADLSIKTVAVVLDKIVDYEGVAERKRFVVKEGLDEACDKMKEDLHDLTVDFMNLEPDNSLSTLGVDLCEFQFVHFPEMDFVIGTKKKLEELNIQTIKQHNIELLLSTNDSTYFRTPNCKRLNDQYELMLSKIIESEMETFNRLIKYINESLADLNSIVKLCGKLDCIISFASVSATFKFVKPTITMDKQLVIKNGRHPLVEQITTKYIPSTTIINEENKHFINVITAPNASGKSIYMKQIAIICYLAHVGMFVPAEECSVSLLSSIFTRIYTPESMYQGESAFLADLQQLSKVVMYSDKRSLVLIDEFGKGTRYKDGLAILSAAVEEFIHREELGPIAFIATHYQQIHDVVCPKEMMNLKTVETEKNDSGVFQSLYQITNGSNGQNFSTEFPESLKIMENILKNQK